MTLDPVPGRASTSWRVFIQTPTVSAALAGSASRSRTLRHALEAAGVLVGGRVDVERAQEPFARWLATRRRIRPTVTAPRQQGQPGAARLARQAAVARHLAGVAGGPMLPPWVEP
jgi:hypothetical protein